MRLINKFYIQNENQNTHAMNPRGSALLAIELQYIVVVLMTSVQQQVTFTIRRGADKIFNKLLLQFNNFYRVYLPPHVFSARRPKYIEI